VVFQIHIFFTIAFRMALIFGIAYLLLTKYLTQVKQIHIIFGTISITDWIIINRRI